MEKTMISNRKKTEEPQKLVIPNVSKNNQLNYLHYGVLVKEDHYLNGDEIKAVVTVVIILNDLPVRCRLFFNSIKSQEYKRYDELFWKDANGEDKNEKDVYGQIVLISLKKASSGNIYIDTIDKAHYKTEHQKEIMEEWSEKILKMVTGVILFDYAVDYEISNEKLLQIPEINDLK